MALSAYAASVIPWSFSTSGTWITRVRKVFKDLTEFRGAPSKANMSTRALDPVYALIIE